MAGYLTVDINDSRQIACEYSVRGCKTDDLRKIASRIINEDLMSKFSPVARMHICKESPEDRNFPVDAST